MATQQPAIDEAKLNEFVGRFAGDLGAVLHAATVLIGDKLGLYKAMSDGAPVSAEELAKRTGTDERYMREWLSAQAASGYVEYDPASDTFRLPAEQAFALTNEYNPLFVPGGLQVAASTIKDSDALAEAIRSGKGVGWHEHHHDLYEGTERFFRPNYIGNLVSAWIPSLDGVEEKLQAGARVADIGCGYGASTIIMAEAYPNSTIMSPPSPPPARPPKKPEFKTGVLSGLPPPRSTPALKSTTSWRSSTACTTWATRRGPQPTCEGA